MDNSSQVTKSIAALMTETNNVSSALLPSDDQCFLMYFIFGTYLGPDLKGDGPQISVLQRLSEGLPPYTSEQLADTQMKTIEVERIYFYVLRKADESLKVKLPVLQKFFRGDLHMPAQDDSIVYYPQFPDLFPSTFHAQTRVKGRQRIIKNIAFINNPEIYYIKPEDIERFKRLTRLDYLFVDREASRMRTVVNGEASDDMAIQEVGSNNEEMPTPLSYVGSPRTLRSNTFSEHKKSVNVVEPANGRMVEGFEKGVIYLPACPTTEEWGNIVGALKTGSALTGSAAKGQVGPAIGLIDIGECEDSYLFRVSLPGVKRDEREFSCEVESDGKVLIRGVTTSGERRVHRYEEVFEMRSQNFSPPGHFSISFRLPGPVDPHQFSGNFGTDAILEGIVMKGFQTM